MDPGSLVPKDKRNKLSGKDDTNGCDRSLNDFPDAILKHMLSFLETRDAVKTSVLCKRWRYMWTSLPSLVFVEQGDEKDRKKFMDFVDRVLHLHDAPPIHKFSLSCCVGYDNSDSRIKTWISAALRCNAKEFNFDLRRILPEANHVFPHCLFISEGMEALKIKLSGGDVQFPSEIFLPSLKCLTLKNVIFRDQHPANLLFASPALEELVIKNCEWIVDRYELIISAPKLWSLTIDEHDMRYSGVDYSSSFITIASPQLKSFNYRGGFLKAYHLPCASSIYKATLDSHNFLKLYFENFVEVLRSLQLVEYLQLSSSFVEGMSRDTLPVFINLINLEISEGPVDLSSKGVEMILSKCTRLETLKFPMGISMNCDLDRLLNSRFTFLSSTLKSITIGAFKGDLTTGAFKGDLVETLVVRFLLAEATFLETMKIFCKKISVSARNHMEDVLCAMPRASKSCKLDLQFI